ncbi:MAG: hypothetical protein P8Y20_00310 [Gammaproteobacteria bacterium]|jgi:archaellum biogenesis ATPase FlaH
MSESFNAQFIDKIDYLLVKCEENATVEQKEKTLDTVVDFIKNQAVENVLFDIRDSLNGMTDEDHLVCGNLISERSDTLSSSKVAFLTHHHEPVLFLSEAYAQGYSNFIELDSIPEASLWFSGQIR